MSESSFSKVQQISTDEMRLNTSSLSPKLQEGYDRLEVNIGQIFVNQYKQLMTDEQIRYLQSPQVIVTNRTTLTRFINTWDTPIEIDEKKAALNGKLIVRYRPKGGNGSKTKGIGAFAGGMMDFHGRLPFYIRLKSYRKIPVDIKSLNIEQHMSGAADMNDQVKRFGETLASNDFSGVAVHEKNHGIQDYDIPLPLREAQSYFLQREIVQSLVGEKGRQRSIPQEGIKLADYFAELIQKYGKDAHRLLWGTMDDQTAAKDLLEEIKKDLTPEKLEQLLTANYEWVTEDL